MKSTLEKPLATLAAVGVTAALAGLGTFGHVHELNLGLTTTGPGPIAQSIYLSISLNREA